LVFLASVAWVTRPAAGRAAAGTDAAARAHFELGGLYQEQVFRSLDRAIAEYEQAVEAKPDHANAQYHLGLAYHTKAKLQRHDKALYRKAMSAYKAYLECDPDGELARRARQNLRVIRVRLR
jgi:tetratricopeptide (TPR) repeat protein